MSTSYRHLFIIIFAFFDLICAQKFSQFSKNNEKTFFFFVKLKSLTLMSCYRWFNPTSLHPSPSFELKFTAKTAVNMFSLRSFGCYLLLTYILLLRYELYMCNYRALKIYFTTSDSRFSRKKTLHFSCIITFIKSVAIGSCNCISF